MVNCEVDLSCYGLTSTTPDGPFDESDAEVDGLEFVSDELAWYELIALPYVNYYY
jgi:hypothetical protein